MAQPSTNPFGAPAGANPFAKPTANPFGTPSAQNANPFGTGPAAASPFGAPAQTSTAFGAPVNNGFGAPAQSGNSVFGAPASGTNNAFNSLSSSAGSSTAFGAPAQPSVFGTSAASAPISNATPFASSNAAPQTQNPFGNPGTSNQNVFGQASSSSLRKPGASTAMSSTNPKADQKKKVTFGGRKEIPNGGPGPVQDRKKLGNGPTREPSEKTKVLSPFAYDYAKKLMAQLQKDKVRPPQWLPQAGDPSKRGAVESLKDAYKKYRTRAYESLRKVDLIDDPDKRRRLEDALPFKGVCEDMCPEFEQIARIAEFDVKTEEKIQGANGAMWPEPSRMVKKFGRSAAGQDAPLPMDVRSVDALRRTTDYLFKDLLQNDNNLPSMHNFLWDRTRAVRKDFTFHSQKTKAEMEVLVYVFETITRFHAVSLHLLSKSGNDDFDQKQEIEQLGRTILSLIEAYDTCKEMGVHCPNEAEFRAYYFLLNYHDSSIRMRSLSEQNDGQPWFESHHIQTALSLIEAMDDLRDEKGPLKPRRRIQMSDSGCGKYFQIVEDPSVSYTMACIANVHFTYVRQNVLKTLVKSYSRHRDAPRTITASILNEFLRFDSTEEAVEFAELHGFEFTSEYPEGKKAPPEPYLRLDRKNKYVPSPRVKQGYSGAIIERKRGSHSLAHVIYNTVFEEQNGEKSGGTGNGNPADELFVKQPTPTFPTSSPSSDNSKLSFSSSTTFSSPLPSPAQLARPADAGPASQTGIPLPAAANSPKFPTPASTATGSVFAPNPQPAATQPTAPKQAPIFGSTPPQPAPMAPQPTTAKLGSIFGSAPAAPQQAPLPPAQPSVNPFGNPLANQTGGTAPAPTPQPAPVASNDTKSPAPSPFSAILKDSAATKTALGEVGSPAIAAAPTTNTSSVLFTAPAAPSALFPPAQPQPPLQEKRDAPAAVPAFKAIPPQATGTVSSPKPLSASTLTPAVPSQPAPNPALGVLGLSAPQPSGALQTIPPKPETPKRDLLGDFTKWYVAGDEGMLTEFTNSFVENLLAGAFIDWQQEEAEKKRKEEDDKSWEEARKHMRYRLSVKYFYRWQENVRQLATKRILREGKEKMKAYRERERALAKQRKEEEEEAARAERRAARRRIMEDGNRLEQLASHPLSATEQDLLASGIFSGLRDERGAVRNVVREAANGADWQVATFSPDYAESVLELEPPRRSIMAATGSNGTGSPDSLEKKEGWKTKSLRQKFGVEPRRSLSASSSINGSIARFRQSLPASAFRASNFSRKRSASGSSDGNRDSKRKIAGKVNGFKSRHWDLRARGFVPLPGGDWVPEAVAKMSKEDGIDEAIRDDESLGSHANEDNMDVVLRMRERLARLRKSENHRLSHHSVGGYEAASPSPGTGNRAVFSTSPTPNTSFAKRKRDSDDDGSEAGSSPSAKKSYIGKSETGVMVEDVRKMLRELHETMDKLDQDGPLIREQIEMSMLGDGN
ncbi:SAC3/GANP/Nin1/mts3/eIF-3 p25 family domain containing protein [Naviculisporaceae sp. PSN 640]